MLGDAPNKYASERLHSELDNVGSCDVTLGVRVIPSTKESRCAQIRSEQVHVGLMDAHPRFL